MAVLNFDATQVAPSTGTQDALPAGWYNVAAESSELKPTKASTPQAPASLLQVVFNVLDGAYAGRKLFSRFNLQNPNQQAVEIAYKDLSAFAHAVGQLRVGDSSELHGKPLKVKVKLRPASGDYEASNDIQAYKNINEQVGPGPVPVVGGFGGAPTAPPGFQPPPQAPIAGGWQAPQAPQSAAPMQPPAQQWQAPATAQPWPNAPAPAAAPQYAPAPVQAAPVQQAAAPVPPFMQQAPVQPAPVQQYTPAPAVAGGPPPWAAVPGAVPLQQA